MAKYTIKALNSDLLEDRKVGHLTADAASGVSTITVDNYSVYADDDYLLLGNFGEPTAEIVQINDASIDNTIDLQSATIYDHYVDTPVTIVKYNQVQFYDSATATGTLATIGSAISIHAGREYTTLYTAPNTSALYWSYKWYDGTNYSEYPELRLYTGDAQNSVSEIAKRGRQLANVEELSKFATREIVISDINMAQDEILHIKDPQSGIPVNWSFELVDDLTSLTSTENENKYALSGLSSTMKYIDSNDAIMNVRFGDAILDYVDPDKFDENFENVHETTLASNITAGDTSVTLTDSYEFGESGAVYIGEDTIVYTSNTETTGVLGGCTGTDNNQTAGASVWQGVAPDKPTEYTIFDGYIKLNAPVDTDYVGYKIKIKYLKEISRIDDIADTIVIPFYNIMENFVAARIEYRKGNSADGDRLMALFRDGLNQNIRRYKLTPRQHVKYHKFDSGDSARA